MSCFADVDPGDRQLHGTDRFDAIGLLVRFQRRHLPWVALVGVSMGYGCQYVFTRVFVVDLPGAF